MNWIISPILAFLYRTYWLWPICAEKNKHQEKDFLTVALQSSGHFLQSFSRCTGLDALFAG